ncbi:hypothetical protein C8R45DRAFT_1010511, partial [Mycena sanguinolenta]
MPMQPPTMSPDAMLRTYAAKHASVAPSLSCKSTAQVVDSKKDAGMRVLYRPDWPLDLTLDRTSLHPTHALAAIVPTATYTRCCFMSPPRTYLAPPVLAAFVRGVAAGVSALYPASVPLTRIAPCLEYRLFIGPVIRRIHPSIQSHTSHFIAPIHPRPQPDFLFYVLHVVSVTPPLTAPASAQPTYLSSTLTPS